MKLLFPPVKIETELVPSKLVFAIYHFPSVYYKGIVIEKVCFVQFNSFSHVYCSLVSARSIFSILFNQ